MLLYSPSVFVFGNVGFGHVAHQFSVGERVYRLLLQVLVGQVVEDGYFRHQAPGLKRKQDRSGIGAYFRANLNLVEVRRKFSMKTVFSGAKCRWEPISLLSCFKSDLNLKNDLAEQQIKLVHFLSNEGLKELFN